MPRRPKPPERTRQRRDTGSISVNTKTGEIRARLPVDEDGKRPSRLFPPGQKGAARAWIDAMMQPAEPEPLPEKTVGEWSGEWWEAHVQAIRPTNTARTYLSHLRYLEPEYGTPLSAVPTMRLQAIVGTLTPRLAPSTVDAIVRVWRQCFEAAVEEEMIRRNPCRRLTLPDVPKPSEQRHLTADEVALLRPAIRGKRFEVAYALMIGCGLRIGEILGLHREHVDMTRRRIWVQWQFTNHHWRPLPKGKNPHWAPMPPWVARIMTAHLARQPAEYVLVLQSPYQSKAARKEKKPRPWSRHTICDELRKIVDGLDVDAFTPHAGRHGIATWMLANGVTPPVIAERLGNTPGVILSTYGHATDAGRERADELVDAYLSQEPPEDASGAETEGYGRAMGQ